MKRLIPAIILWLLVCGCCLLGCQENKPQPAGLLDSDILLQETDSTIYGICGEGSTIDAIQLISDLGDTLHIQLPTDEEFVVLGGMMAGDRLALTYHQRSDDALQLDCSINLTTLQGRWQSIDRKFELCEGGTVAEEKQSNRRPWTTWKILNGRLLLNADTFSIARLSADSLELETPTEIFLYTKN